MKPIVLVWNLNTQADKTPLPFCACDWRYYRPILDGVKWPTLTSWVQLKHGMLPIPLSYPLSLYTNLYKHTVTTRPRHFLRHQKLPHTIHGSLTFFVFLSSIQTLHHDHSPCWRIHVPQPPVQAGGIQYSVSILPPRRSWSQSHGVQSSTRADKRLISPPDPQIEEIQTLYSWSESNAEKIIKIT